MRMEVDKGGDENQVLSYFFQDKNQNYLQNKYDYDTKIFNCKSKYRKTHF